MEEGFWESTKGSAPSWWVQLLAPAFPDSAGQIAKEASALATVVDITYQPALFGRFLDSKTQIMVVHPGQLHFTDSFHGAYDEFNAGLIQILSAIGRTSVNLLFLKVSEPLTQFQIDGAVSAIKDSQEEGAIQKVGLAVQGNGSAALAVLEKSDLFSYVLVSSQVDASILNSIKEIGLRKELVVVRKAPLNSTGSLDQNATQAKPPLPFENAEAPQLIPVSSLEDISTIASLIRRSNKSAPDSVVASDLKGAAQ